ncbi:MAG: hypothetical protein J6S71_05630, partial [Clostridia bacterium]|nr:hypothetical protein [Clostridia bacterium]
MKLKRFFALIICAMMLMTSCSDDILDPIITDPGEEFPTSELVTEAPSAVSLEGYKVIRSEKASAQIISATVDFKKKIEAEAGTIAIGDDWYKSGDTLPEKALEILVGATNRPETAEVITDLLADDFAIKYFPESGRIVICGGSDEATVKALNHFLEFCFKEGEIEYSLSFFSAGQYAVSECLLEGTPISEYSLVIPSSADADEKYAAEMISACVREKMGIDLKTVKVGSASGKMILIGRASDYTVKDSEYAVGTKDGNVILCGEGGLVVKAARVLLDELFPKGQDKVALTLGETKAITFNRISLPTLTDFGTKPIALADQLNASIAVYDLASGEAVLKYEFKPKTSNGFSLEGYGNRVDEA